MLVNQLDRDVNNLTKRYKVKLSFKQEDNQILLLFSCLDSFEVRQLFNLFAMNYRIDSFSVTEL